MRRNKEKEGVMVYKVSKASAKGYKSKLKIGNATSKTCIEVKTDPSIRLSKPAHIITKTVQRVMAILVMVTMVVGFITSTPAFPAVGVPVAQAVSLNLGNTLSSDGADLVRQASQLSPYTFSSLAQTEVNGYSDLANGIADTLTLGGSRYLARKAGLSDPPGMSYSASPYSIGRDVTVAAGAVDALANLPALINGARNLPSLLRSLPALTSRVAISCEDFLTPARAAKNNPAYDQLINDLVGSRPTFPTKQGVHPKGVPEDLQISSGAPFKVEPGPKYLWTIDETGKLRIAREGDSSFGIKHPQLVDENPVYGAGEVTFGADGKVTDINIMSGRYMLHPRTYDYHDQVLVGAKQLFKALGH